MKLLFNPDNGADIKDVYKQVIYRHPKETTLRYADDEVALYMLKKYEFLQDWTQNPIIKDPETIEEPQTEEWLDAEDFGPDRREQRRARERLAQEEDADMKRDPESYYGKGLTEDRTNDD